MSDPRGETFAAVDGGGMKRMITLRFGLAPIVLGQPSWSTIYTPSSANI
jgi:hypothetical protein